MELFCPKCTGTIEVDSEKPPAKLQCGKCGSTFINYAEETISFVLPGNDLEVTYIPEEHEKNTDTPSQSIDDYEIIEEIARGGMGVVYKARQVSLNRIVALKMILAGTFASETDIRRFRTEAEAAAHLDHPNIVPVYEVGESGGHHYFSMGFVDGSSLAERIVDQPLPPLEAAHIVKVIAKAVDFAHKNGIVHRDLKPANILIDSSGQPHITDFGLAKRIDTSEGMTATGDILGTPNYMSPEQAKGEIKKIGPLTDVYGLGAILYCLITRRPPFQAATAIDTLLLVVEKDPVPPSQLNTAVDQDLETICLKCLEKQPGHRYSSASELCLDLERYSRHESISARPISSTAQCWRWCRRNRTVALLSAAFVFALILGTIFSTIFAVRANRSASLMKEEKTRADIAAAKEHKASQLAHEREKEAQENALRADENAQKMRLALYRSLVEKTHTLTGQKSKPGWSWLALEALEKANDLKPDDTESTELRSQFAQALCGTDFRHIKTIAKNIDASVLVYSPGGTYLAVGQRKNAAWCSIDLFDPSNLKQIKRVTVSNVSNSFGKLFTGSKLYQDGITSIAFSPDEKWIVAGTRFGQIVRWDLSTKESKPIIWKSHAEVDRIIFSTDGEKLYSCGKDGNNKNDSPVIKTWSVNNDWKEITSQKHLAEDIDITDDDTISFIHNGHLKLADINSLKTDSKWPQNRDAGLVCLSHDGREIYIDNGPGIGFIDRYSGIQNREIIIDDNPSLRLLDLSPRSELLAVTDNMQKFHLIETATGQTMQSVVVPGRDEPIAVFSTDGLQLAVAGNRQTEIYEIRGLQTNGFHRVIGRHPQPINEFDLSDNGRHIVMTGEAPLSRKDSQSHAMSVWNTDTGQVVHDMKFFSHPRNKWFSDKASTVAFKPDSTDIMWSPSFMRPINVTGQKEPAYYEDPAFPSNKDQVVIQESKLIVVENSGQCKVVDDSQASNGRAMRISGGKKKTLVRLQFEKPSSDIGKNAFAILMVARVEFNGILGRAFSFSQKTEKTSNKSDVPLFQIPSQDYQLFYIAYVQSDNSGQFDIDIWLDEQSPNVTAMYIDRIELVSLKELNLRKHVMETTAFSSLCFSPGNKRAWSIVDRKTVVSWDLNTGKIISHWKNQASEYLTGKGQVNCLATGTQWTAAGRRDGTVQIFETNSGKAVKLLRVTGTPVDSVAIHKNQELVAVGTEDGRIQLLNPVSGRKIKDWQAHSDSVKGIVCDSNKNIFISGSFDQFLRVWKWTGDDVRLLMELKTSGPVKQIRLSDDGHTLAALIEGEHSVHLWNIDKLKSEFKRLKLDW
jgi:WD40 repeat protein/tRNA A-37 threonylcarbamoyl transferase component Bud32